MMKVKELIEKLETFDQDKNVYIPYDAEYTGNLEMAHVVSEGAVLNDEDKKEIAIRIW